RSCSRHHYRLVKCPGCCVGLEALESTRFCIDINSHIGSRYITTGTKAVNCDIVDRVKVKHYAAATAVTTRVDSSQCIWRCRATRSSRCYIIGGCSAQVWCGEAATSS